MKHFAIGLIALVWSSIGLAQINIEGAFGGTNNDSITFVSPLESGNGYLIMGYTNSFTADEEIFIMRTDLAGNAIWARNFFVKNNQNEPIAICEGNDGDVIVVFAKNGTDELFVAKYNETTKEFDWNKTNPGFINGKKAYDFIAVDSDNDGTKDGYVLSIHALGNANRGQLLFINNAGEVTHKLSEDQWDVNITDLMVTNDNRLLAAGRRNDGADVILMEIDFTTFTVIDANSQMYNSKVRQSNDAKVDYVKMTQGADGSIVIIAHHSEAGKNNEGRIIIKTDADGSNPVTYEYGLANVDDFYLTDVGATSNGYTFAGYTGSAYTNSYGQRDIIFVRTDENLELRGASIFGGEKDDVGVFVFENNDNSVSIFANTNSFSDNNDNDFYVVKSSDNSPVLCNEKSVAFSIQVAESVTSVPYVNVFNTVDNVGSASDITDNYEYKDITFDPECFCEADLSFQVSSNACVGEPVMVSVPGVGLEYVWDFGSDMLDTVTIDGTLYVTYGSAGIKYIHLEVENAGGCINPATRNVDVHSLPNVEIGFDSDNNCTAEPFKFYNEETNIGNIKYDWSFGNSSIPAVSHSAAPEGIYFADTATVTYVSLTVENSKCSNTDVDTITLFPSPTVAFTVGDEQCTGETVDFNFTGEKVNGVNYTYTWDFDGGVGATTDENPQDVTFASKGEKTITLTVTTGDNCSVSESEVITIFQTPIINGIVSAFPAIPNTGCTGFPVNFTSDVVAEDDSQWEYIWNFGTGSYPNNSSAINPEGIIYNEAGTGIEVQLLVKDEHCSATSTTTLDIAQTPTADFESSATLCSEEDVEFFNTGTQEAEGADFIWVFSLDDILNIDTDPTVVALEASKENPSGIAYLTQGQKYVQLVTSLGTCTDTARKAITIHQTPDIQFTSNAAQCVGDYVNFSNSGLATSSNNPEIYWNYSWDFGTEAEPATSNAENPAGITYATGGTKTVTFNISSDYCSKTLTQEIEINELPTVTVIDDATICANRSIAIGDANANTTDFSYAWKTADKDFTESTEANPTVEPDASYTEYILTVTNNSTGCQDTDTVVVTMLKNAIADAGQDVEICWGDDIQIGAAYIEGQTYMWTVVNDMDDPFSPSPIVDPKETTDYILSAQYEGCDAIYDTVRVIVHQLPNVKAKTVEGQDSIDIALGETTQLFASGAIQYEWTLPTEPFHFLDNDGIYNPLSTPDYTGTFEYWLEGIDVHGCINYDSVIVYTRMPSTWIPTSFTPNGDELNDEFLVRTEGEVDNFVLHIFTRSGEEIFYSTDASEAWDGTNQTTSEDMPIGAYIYYTHGTLSNGELFEFKDVINLVR